MVSELRESYKDPYSQPTNRIISLANTLKPFVSKKLRGKKLNKSKRHAHLNSCETDCQGMYISIGPAAGHRKTEHPPKAKLTAD